jgi:hypothetical protein
MDDIPRQVEKHVFVKDVRRMSDQSHFGRKNTPAFLTITYSKVEALNGIPSKRLLQGLQERPSVLPGIPSKQSIY